MNDTPRIIPIHDLATIYTVGSHACTLHLSDEGRTYLILIARTYGFMSDDDTATAEGIRIILAENFFWAREELAGTVSPLSEIIETAFDDEQLPLPIGGIGHDE